jgi:AGZA family xanthine/uracil permease-like MFS transporter
MATFYALGAAVLSFFGVIHGEKLGWAQSWPVALGYLLLGTLCAIMALREGAGELEDHTAAAKAAAAR